MAENFPVGYIDRPSYDDDNLQDTVGYITSLYVEQEGGRDQIVFTLQIYYGRTTIFEHTMVFNIYLDLGTTAAFAQLQLLRDALESMIQLPVKTPLLVRVHFSFREEDNYDTGNAYLVRLITEQAYPTTVDSYFGSNFGWFTHVD